MSRQLRVVLIVLGITLIFIILSLIAKRKLPIKYSLFWFFSAFIILLVGIVPNFIRIFTKLIGFETTSNLVIDVIMGLLLLITLLLTIIISEQKRKIVLLIQEISILKEKNK